MSTKGSYADPEGKGLPKDLSDVSVDLIGLYVVNDQSTMLVALGKVYDNSSTIHTVPYVDDVTRVSVSQFTTVMLRSLFLRQR